MESSTGCVLLIQSSQEGEGWRQQLYPPDQGDGIRHGSLDQDDGSGRQKRVSFFPQTYELKVRDKVC